RALYLARLKHHVAIRHDDWKPDLTQPRDDFERAGIQPLGERVVQHIRCHMKEPRIAVVDDAETLQRAEIVRVSELAAQRLVERPVAIASRRAEFLLEP